MTWPIFIEPGNGDGGGGIDPINPGGGGPVILPPVIITSNGEIIQVAPRSGVRAPVVNVNDGSIIRDTAGNVVGSGGAPAFDFNAVVAWLQSPGPLGIPIGFYVAAAGALAIYVVSKKGK